MRIAIHQPNYLPWLGFFYKMLNVEKFVLLDTVQFSKNSIQNRNKIKTPQGPLWLTVPVYTKGKFMQKTREVQINAQEPWREKTRKTITLNYSKARCFKDAEDGFFKVYFSKDWSGLSELCAALIRFIAERLAPRTQIILASELPCGEGKNASELLIDICKHFGAQEYFSGMGGKNYMDEQLFAREGIKVVYSDFKHPVYPQLYGDFVSQLSIVDLLFNCGEESGKILEAAH